MNLQDVYNREEFLNFIKGFIPGFSTDVRPASATGLQVTEKVAYLGESRELDISVFEITHASTRDARVKLAMDGFRVMKSNAVFRALIIYRSEKSNDWRLSLMTATLSPNEKGKVSETFSNPRRFSFFLGPNAKINTPNRFLVKEGPVKDFGDLQRRFSLEVVNKEFYKGISESFIKLVGGEIGAGKNKKTYNLSLKLPSNDSKNKTTMEFAVRLIGRIIFCWFLREKKGQNGVSLMPRELLSSEAILKNQNYYHSVLEPIFFEVLNKEMKSREDKWNKESFSQIPYLNGGLFSPQYDDHYDLDRGILVSRHINTLVIPDTWFIDFFNILESYNFTIDENTSFDEELSIDPEMLGRIFENLLAEINPETGESARKSTGSFYTPRAIVDYMVDESLILFLKQKTEVEEDKIRALISYDLTDDEQYPLKEEEKQKIIDALEKLKLLDPACGSGAFPMGALQKIVFILQRVDPEAQLWFNKQVANTAPEIRRVIEREFKHKNFDYIRKLGIIRENIYGVDIQAIAIEISRLRCFLTLVVDERIDDSLENRGIEPLPNLDFKFVVANSLIGLKNNHETTEGLFKDQEGINRLKSVREQYFNATNSERYRLQNEFNNIQKQMLFKMYEMKTSDEYTQKLSIWEPFSNKKVDWFDSEWMFGIDAGFDIVIANPPYINIFNIKDDAFRKYLVTNYSVAKNKTDLYAFFIEQGNSLLRPSGILVFIFSNSWLGTDSFSKFRKYLIENTKIEQLVKCPPGIFEEATVTVVIMLLTKDKVDNNDIELLNFANGRFEKLGFNLSYNFIKNQVSHGFSFNRQISINIPAIKLGDLVHFSLGIKTSNDEKFVMDEKKDANSYKMLRGKDVHRWFYNFSNKWIWYKPDLMNERKGAGPRRLEYFTGPKLLIRDVASQIEATYDNNNYLTTDTISIVFGLNSQELKFILGLLNSKFINKWFKLNFDAGLHIKINQLQNIPIPKDVRESDKEKIIELTDKILFITTNENYLNTTEEQKEIKTFEKQIDDLVYKLYGLTEEEIKIVENSNNGEKTNQ